MDPTQEKEVLKEALTCDVCTELFEDPRILPCHHSFCSKCIGNLQTSNPNIGYTLRCPICKKITNENVDTFPSDWRAAIQRDRLETIKR